MKVTVYFLCNLVTHCHYARIAQTCSCDDVSDELGMSSSSNVLF